MTTISYKGGILAADTLSSRGFTAIEGVTKIARGGDGRMGGGCGRASFVAQFLAWIEGRIEDPPSAETSEDNTDTGLVIWPDGTIELHESGGRFKIDTPYYALGSGRDQALGAMFMGGSAMDGVRAAVAHDVYTGGEITVLRR